MMTRNSYELGGVTSYGTTFQGWRSGSSEVSTFRRLLPQVIASLACNFVLLDLNLSLAFPTIVIAKLYQSKEDALSLDDDQATWIGSIAYICQPFGSLSSGLLVEWLGRKRFMMLLNIPFLAAWILLYTAPSYTALCIAEVIVGITIGLTEAPINSYIGEVCQPEIRGMMTACAGVFYQFGFFLEYLLGSLLPWRTAAAISASIPIVTAILIAIAPEAPIWLISKGRKQDAEKALCWLRGWVDPSAVREELEELTRYHKETQLLLTAPRRKPTVPTISGNIQENCIENPSYVPEKDEEKEKQNGSPRQTATQEDSESEEGGVHCCGKRVEMLDRMRDLIRPPTLRPLFLVIPYFFFVHWSGMTSIRPFMVHVFEKYHMPIDAEMSTVVSGSAGIVGTVLMMFTVHRLGKRCLSLYCTAGSAIAALLLGTYAHVELGTAKTPQATWVPLTLFVILYFCNSIQGQMPWMLLSEIFPFRTRGLSGGISAAGCYVFLFLSTHLYLDIEKSCQLQGAFWIYGSISVIGFVFLYFRLLETEGKSLEEIEDHFTRGLKPRTGK